MTDTIHKKLMRIQKELKAPKSQWNKFGKFNYRSCEDIVEALKPILLDEQCVLTMSDSMEGVCERVYVKASVMLVCCETEAVFGVTAFAREAEEMKGMGDSQITGAASSYARKYALNGMFCIDDTKDADAIDNSKKQDNNPRENEAMKESKKDACAVAAGDLSLKIDQAVSVEALRVLWADDGSKKTMAILYKNNIAIYECLVAEFTQRSDELKAKEQN